MVLDVVELLPLLKLLEFWQSVMLACCIDRNTSHKFYKRLGLTVARLTE